MNRGVLTVVMCEGQGFEDTTQRRIIERNGSKGWRGVIEWWKEHDESCPGYLVGFVISLHDLRSEVVAGQICAFLQHAFWTLAKAAVTFCYLMRGV